MAHEFGVMVEEEESKLCPSPLAGEEDVEEQTATRDLRSVEVVPLEGKRLSLSLGWRAGVRVGG